MSKTLADQIEAIALGVERGDSLPAPAGRKLREIAAKVREMEARPARDGHPIPPYGYVPDETQAPYIAGPDTGPFGESLDD